jgi:hypothetical protein
MFFLEIKQRKAFMCLTDAMIPGATKEFLVYLQFISETIIV